jgi:DNA-binding CsgD family transcriptional regulator
LAASGLTAGLISQQIDISERTVIYYLGRAEEKLGVRTRQHAIARAIFLGELEPDCYPMLISQSQKVIDIGN